MTNHQIIERFLQRIAEATERIASALESRAAPEKIKRDVVATARLPGKNIQALIKIYIDSWRLRYSTTARPDISKANGIFGTLLKSYTFEQLSELLQIYPQMTDEWFDKRRHDLSTFHGNVSKVALARDKGLNSTDVNWGKVFGNGRGSISKTGREIAGELRREGLSRGADHPLLEGPEGDE